MLRAAGDTLIVTPALIIGEAEIGDLVEGLRHAIRAVA